MHLPNEQGWKISSHANQTVSTEMWGKECPPDEVESGSRETAMVTIAFPLKGGSRNISHKRAEGTQSDKTLLVYNPYPSNLW